jgi:hypothetical protein
MKTIGEAVLEFKARNQKCTVVEITAFIAGWTALEVAIDSKIN